MKKLLILLLFICFITSSCVNKNNKQEVLKFSTWGSATELSILKPIIQDFEVQNPNMKIELLHIPQNYFQKIHLLFASNLAPDVVFINNLNLPIYANYLEPLNFDTTIYYPQTIQALSYNGIKYVIPRDVSNLVLYYNKRFYNGERIKDLNNLLKTTQELTNKKHWGISYEDEMFYAMPYIYSMNENEEKGTLFYKDLAYKYHVAPTKSETGTKTLAQMFLEEKIAMHLSGRWLYPKYKECAKFDWGVMTFPGTVPCDASGWAISKSSKHKASAHKFLEYISSKENIQKLNTTGLIVPARKDINIEEPVFIEAIKSSKPTNITPDHQKHLDKLKEKYLK